jgi:hypothetical protein
MDFFVGEPTEYTRLALRLDSWYTYEYTYECTCWLVSIHFWLSIDPPEMIFTLLEKRVGKGYRVYTIGSVPGFRVYMRVYIWVYMLVSKHTFLVPTMSFEKGHVIADCGQISAP